MQKKKNMKYYFVKYVPYCCTADRQNGTKWQHRLLPNLEHDWKYISITLMELTLDKVKTG